MLPFAGMPGSAQAPGEIFPLTRVLRVTRGLMLKGASAADAASENAWLVGFLLLHAAIAILRFRRRLE